MLLSAVFDSHSDGTHSLQSIHWWASDAMQHFSKSDEEILFIFRWTTHLKEFWVYVIWKGWGFVLFAGSRRLNAECVADSLLSTSIMQPFWQQFKHFSTDERRWEIDYTDPNSTIYVLLMHLNWTAKNERMRLLCNLCYYKCSYCFRCCSCRVPPQICPGTDEAMI